MNSERLGVKDTGGEVREPLQLKGLRHRREAQHIDDRSGNGAADNSTDHACVREGRHGARQRSALSSESERCIEKDQAADPLGMERGKNSSERTAEGMSGQ